MVLVGIIKMRSDIISLRKLNPLIKNILLVGGEIKNCLN
jgi:hypothetical protein